MHVLKNFKKSHACLRRQYFSQLQSTALLSEFKMLSVLGSICQYLNCPPCFIFPVEKQLGPLDEEQLSICCALN